ncbi:TPA: endonuclease I [Kluyvera georgiana]
MNFRSNFEKDFSKSVDEYEYESKKLKYVVTKTYTPDFLVGNILIETKGYFKPADRSKHLAIKEQHPELDIRFVFQNSNNKLSKNSKTTYGQWADKHGFKWANKKMPDSWKEEIDEWKRNNNI